jgi:hypothetical protein
MSAPAKPPTAAKVGAVAPVASKPTPAPVAAPLPETTVNPDASATGGDKVLNWLSKNWKEEDVLNAIISEDHFVGNLANQYNNLSYDWKLYCMPPTDYLAEFDGDSAGNSIKEFYAKLDAYKQVIIADTGVTNYNISEVEITSSMADDSYTATAITMKISEPNGVSFLDALQQAATEAGIENYNDFYYFLELGFKGYDVLGNIVETPFVDLENGGRWIWGVKINTIDVNLSTSGGQYTLSMLPIEQQAIELDGEYGALLDTIIVRGNTLGDFFTEFFIKINSSWESRLYDPEIVKHEYQFHALPPAPEVSSEASSIARAKAVKKFKDTNKEFVKGVHGAKGLDAKKKAYDDGLDKLNDQAAATKQAQANEKDAKEAVDIVSQVSKIDNLLSLPMRPENGDWNSLRSSDRITIITPKTDEDNVQKSVLLEEQSNEVTDVATTPTAHFPQGSRIHDVINAICGACEPLQNLAKNSTAQKQGADDSDEKVNDEGHRQAITWNIVPEMRLSGKYDPLSNRYNRRIIWHVYPSINQNIILSATQIQEAKKEEVQKKMWAALAARGFLPKKYDYLFTGLNTEVINFDLNFNMAWAASLPRMDTYYDEQAVQHARWNPNLVLKGDILAKNAQAIRQQQEAHQTYINVRTDTIEQVNKKLLSRADGLARINKAAADSKESQRQAQAIAQQAKKFREENQSKQASPEQDYSRRYVEDILDDNEAMDVDSSSTLFAKIPLSFSAERESKNATGPGITGQYHAGKSIYGSILNQVNGPMTNSFAKMDMQIRGDPFWIGRGSFEKALAHKREVIDGRYLHNDLNGLNCVLLEFKYPVDTSSDGNIELKDNNVVSGIYGITRTTCTFSGGLFTQKLEGIRYTLFDRAMALANVNTSQMEDSE